MSRLRFAALRALAMLVFARLALRACSLRQVRRWLRTGSRFAAMPEYAVTPAVRAAARRLPGARHCLAEAVVAEALLQRAGCRAELRLGVALDPSSRFAAHAWLDRAGVASEERGAFHELSLPPGALE